MAPGDVGAICGHPSGSPNIHFQDLKTGLVRGIIFKYICSFFKLNSIAFAWQF